MKRGQKTMLVLAMAVFMVMVPFVPGLTLAGDLGFTEETPSYAPGEGGDVESRGWLYSRAWVEKTGQTESYGPGDDGDLEKGVVWPVPRFRDNGNGTVTDRLTGLIWLKNANCFGTMVWDDALSLCNDLQHGDCGLTDGSEPGDWRFPNVKELHSLIHFGYVTPALPNTEGTGQWTEGDPFTGVQSGPYWSSTAYADYPDDASWFVYLGYGIVLDGPKAGSYYVWPVRGGR